MRVRSFLSYPFIFGGSVLLFLGARDFVEARMGQADAARDFEAAVWNPAPAAKAPRPRPGDTLAKLMIPRLEAQLYIVEGDGPQELRRGPGHLTGTAMPGAAGNCVIAGHRDTHFRVLKNIRKGDDIVLESDRGVFLYRVERTRIVSPLNTSALQPTGTAELNLITCYPFYYVGSAPRRFVVEARLAGAGPPRKIE
jgi:sortase A